MAGFEKIKQRIIEEAQQIANENISKAQNEAQNILAKAKSKADANSLQIGKKSKVEAIEVKKRVLANADLEIRKDKLKMRQALVHEVFDNALVRLCSLPTEKYQKVVSNLAIDMIETGNEEIIFSKNDKSKIGLAVVEEVNQRLSAAGKASSVKLSDTDGDIKGGFLLKSGNVIINSSFETILRMKRDQLEAEVFGMLFDK